MQWGRSHYISMFPCSHGTIFDGTEKENSKTRGGRGQIRKIQENKKEIIEERKRRDLRICGGSHTRVFAIGWGCPGLPPLCDPPSGEPTHMGTSLTTSQIGKKARCYSCPPHKSLHTSNNTSDSIKCQVQLQQAIMIYSFCRGEMTGTCSTGQGLYYGQL